MQVNNTDSAVSSEMEEMRIKLAMAWEHFDAVLQRHHENPGDVGLERRMNVAQDKYEQLESELKALEQREAAGL